MRIRGRGKWGGVPTGGVGERQEEEEEEAEAKKGKGKNKWWWWLDKCTSRACGATTTDNATAPPRAPM
jgi:hypothetical protein